MAKREIPDITYASPEDPKFKTILIRSIERLTGKRKMERLYEGLLDQHEREMVTFWEAALTQLQVQLEFNEEQLARIPKTGPILFIANHPFGVLDGLIICHLASKARENFKILINRALCQVDLVESNMLPIDFAETKEAMMINISSKKKAIETMRQNGAIVIFPAGGISTSTNAFGKAIDLEWKLFAGKLIQQTKATVVPVYFHGQNSRIFQIASQFSLTLRLSLIIREVNRKIGKKVFFTIGDPIPYQELEGIKGRKELLHHLREVTYSLSDRYQ